VQISPPQEHRVIYSNGERPWWERYQPVSYKLVSRSGTREELADMIKRCNAVGVEIYADAVINHMSGLLGQVFLFFFSLSSASFITSHLICLLLPISPATHSPNPFHHRPQGQKETGTAGSTFSYYEYPSFKYNDFHHFPDNGGQGNCGIQSSDYQNNAWRVQHCDLSGLTDLDTGSSYVQSTITAYLKDLISLGVKGFRIDAAKHMTVEDLGNILKNLNGSLIYQEVIDLGNEAVKYEDYLHLGSLCEFLYGSRLTSTFRTGKLSS
jgi:alpha-amylase